MYVDHDIHTNTHAITTWYWYTFNIIMIYILLWRLWFLSLEEHVVCRYVYTNPHLYLWFIYYYVNRFFWDRNETSYVVYNTSDFITQIWSSYRFPLISPSQLPFNPRHHRHHWSLTLRLVNLSLLHYFIRLLAEPYLTRDQKHWIWLLYIHIIMVYIDLFS